jgi:hypothetical protein
MAKEDKIDINLGSGIALHGEADDGTVTWQETQVADWDKQFEPLREHEQARQAFNRRNSQGHHRHVAEIPAATWNMLKRSGVADDPAALAKWLSDPDQKVFRMDGGGPVNLHKKVHI